MSGVHIVLGIVGVASLDGGFHSLHMKSTTSRMKSPTMHRRLVFSRVKFALLGGHLVAIHIKRLAPRIKRLTARIKRVGPHSTAIPSHIASIAMRCGTPAASDALGLTDISFVGTHMKSARAPIKSLAIDRVIATSDGKCASA